eukprot:m.6288 g.6288  ORF g.6288 m.6288 type:complete len:191 (+) comp5143_c0_seq2:357-929(+)
MSHNLFAALAELKSSAPEDVDPEMEGFGESWVPTDRSNTPHKRTPRIAENPRYRAQTVSRADLAGASDDSSDSESDEQEQDDDAAAQEQASDADDADSDSDSDGGSAASSEEEDNDVAYDTSATDKMKSELAALQQTEVHLDAASAETHFLLAFASLCLCCVRATYLDAPTLMGSDSVPVAKIKRTSVQD